MIHPPKGNGTKPRAIQFASVTLRSRVWPKCGQLANLCDVVASLSARKNSFDQGF
jgi:hypothetical protein